MIEAAKAFIESIFRGNSGGHDAAHTLRVYKNAIMIADREHACDREIVALAALLHDVDDHKLFNTHDNANARGFLEAQGVSQERISMILEIVNSVSFSRNRGKRPVTLEGMIVQDADRLDAIGAVGIARAFAFGGEHGRTIDASVQHFYDKLLLLKDEMNTLTAKKIAEERHAFMLSFLKEYAVETEYRMDVC